MLKKDCAMYVNVRGVDGCSALSTMLCARGECSFYKTKEDVGAQMRKVIARKTEMGIILNAHDKAWAETLGLSG